MRVKYSNCYVDESVDLSLHKLLVNVEDRIVENRADWRCPKLGDKIKILSYDTQVACNECVRVSKLEYLTVKEIIPVVVGVGNERYCWSYKISVNESYLQFLQYYYEILS